MSKIDSIDIYIIALIFLLVFSAFSKKIVSAIEDLELTCVCQLENGEKQ